MIDRAVSASSHNQIESAKHIPRFPDLRTAGKLLAEKLRAQEFTDALVLAIASGGVPVAHEVATQLGLPFDVILIKRLFMRNGPGPPLCAVSVAGTMVLDEQIDVPTDPSSPVEYFLVDALKQLLEREEICRGARPPTAIADRKVLLVDCAIHTGSTMTTALCAVRKLKPARIVSAVPVASHEGHLLIEEIADDAFWLAQPEPFGNAGMWYEDFTRPPDSDMPHLLYSA